MTGGMEREKTKGQTLRLCETARRLIGLGRKDARKVLAEAEIGEFCK